MGMTFEFKHKTNKQIEDGLQISKGKMVQKYLDKTVAKNLQPYVSLKTATQEKSIMLSLVPGDGLVHINVPYAQYQAYSKKIKKRNGKRGTRPFERMKADKSEFILREVTNYARKVDK